MDNIIFTTQIPLRVSDINYGNHLGHDALISILHEARVQFLKHHQYTELDVCGCGMILANINVDYLAQGFYPDTLCIAIGIREQTKTSLTLIYQVKSTQQEKDIAAGSTVMVFYDYAKQKVVRVPEELIEKLNL